MILPYQEIMKRCEEGMVEPFDPSLVNPASLDIRLGNNIKEMTEIGGLFDVDISEFTEENPYLALANTRFLAESLEVFNFPDDVAGEFKLKSSRAREFLQHLLAGWCDPGWHGSRLTMEFIVLNLDFVPLWPGMKIGQIVFYQLDSPTDLSYSVSGRYNNDLGVTASKG